MEWEQRYSTGRVMFDVNTVESSLLVGFNVLGFRSVPLPTNLCPYKRLLK